MSRALLFPFLAAYALFLRWTIWEAESHLRACAEDGILEGVSLTAFRAQIDAERDVQKARLDAQLEAQKIEFERWKATLDNETRLQIEYIKRGDIVGPEAMSVMNGQAQANDQLAQSITSMMQQAIQQIRAPRRIIRDANGRAQGLE